LLGTSLRKNAYW